MASLCRVSRGEKGGLYTALCIGGIALLFVGHITWIYSSLFPKEPSPALKMTMMPLWTAYMLSFQPLLKSRVSHLGKIASLWSALFPALVGYSFLSFLDPVLRDYFHVSSVVGAAGVWSGATLAMYLALYATICGLIAPLSVTEREEIRRLPRAFGSRVVCVGIAIAAFDLAEYLSPNDKAMQSVAGFIASVGSNMMLIQNDMALKQAEGDTGATNKPVL